MGAHISIPNRDLSRRGRIAAATGLCLAVLLALTASVAHANNLAQADGCRRDYQGIEYCTADAGQTHILRIDLTERDIVFDVATASNARGPNPPQWQPGYRQTVAQMARAHLELDGQPLAAAITGDYGASDGSHGWQGLMVQQGQRLDGPGTNAPDCDCGSSIASALSLSRSRPIRVQIGPRTAEELDQYELYATRCKGALPFRACEQAFLARTPAPDEDARYQARLKDEWYTTIGGGPIIVRNGQAIPISQACRQEGFSGDWCADQPNVSADRLRQLRMGTVAGVTADGRQLILIVTTARLPNELSQLLAEQGAHTGLRFDGSLSAQMWYAGQELTGNTRRISNALLVYSRLLPEDHASPTSALFYDVVLPGETAQLEIRLRNEGRATWAGPGYELRRLSGHLPAAPEVLPLQGPVPPGDTATWTIRIPVSTMAAPRLLRYQMHHNGQPFGQVATGYIIVLPEELREFEGRIREQIEEWQRQGEQAVEELMQQIWETIQAEIERQARSFLEKLLEGCLGPGTMLGLVLALVWRRSHRLRP